MRDDTHLFTYVAGATDAGLDRDLPIGTRLDKKRGQLAYRINGRWQSFPVAVYGTLLGGALALVLVGLVDLFRYFFVLRRQRKL